MSPFLPLLFRDAQIVSGISFRAGEIQIVWIRERTTRYRQTIEWQAISLCLVRANRREHFRYLCCPLPQWGCRLRRRHLTGRDASRSRWCGRSLEWGFELGLRSVRAACDGDFKSDNGKDNRVRPLRLIYSIMHSGRTAVHPSVIRRLRCFFIPPTFVVRQINVLYSYGKSATNFG